MHVSKGSGRARIKLFHVCIVMLLDIYHLHTTQLLHKLLKTSSIHTIFEEEKFQNNYRSVERHKRIKHANIQSFKNSVTFFGDTQSIM